MDELDTKHRKTVVEHLIQPFWSLSLNGRLKLCRTFLKFSDDQNPRQHIRSILRH